MFYLHTNPLSWLCVYRKLPTSSDRNKLTCKLDKQPKHWLEELIESRMMFGGTGPRVEVSGVETVSWQKVPAVSSYTLAQHRTHNIQLSSLSYADPLFLPFFMHCKSYSLLINNLCAISKVDKFLQFGFIQRCS